MSDQDRRPLFSTKLVLGLGIIAVGLIMVLDNLHIYDAWRLLNWWPAFLVAFGIAHLVRDGILGTGGHIWLGLAVAGFIQQFGPWGLLERWWPIFLVWGGAIVSLRALFPQPKRLRKPESDRPSPRPPNSCDPGTDSTQVNR